MGTDEEWVPTTQNVHDGFALSYAKDYEPFSDDWLKSSRFGHEAFHRWLERFTARIRHDAWHEGYAAHIDGLSASEGPEDPDAVRRRNRDEELVEKIMAADHAGEHDKAEGLEALLWLRRNEES
jgi:hypothetical protein